MTDTISDESVFLAYKKVRDLPVWGESKPKEGTAVLAVVAILNSDIGYTLHFFAFEMMGGVGYASYSTNLVSGLPSEVETIPQIFNERSSEHESLCTIIFGDEDKQPQGTCIAKVLAWIPMEEVDETLSTAETFLAFLQKAYDVVLATAHINYDLYDYLKSLKSYAKAWRKSNGVYAFPKTQAMLKVRFSGDIWNLTSTQNMLIADLARISAHLTENEGVFEDLR